MFQDCLCGRRAPGKAEQGYTRMICHGSMHGIGLDRWDGMKDPQIARYKVLAQVAISK